MFLLMLNMLTVSTAPEQLVYRDLHVCKLHMYFHSVSLHNSLYTTMILGMHLVYIQVNLQYTLKVIVQYKLHLYVHLVMVDKPPVKLPTIKNYSNKHDFREHIHGQMGATRSTNQVEDQPDECWRLGGVHILVRVSFLFVLVSRQSHSRTLPSRRFTFGNTSYHYHVSVVDTSIYAHIIKPILPYHSWLTCTSACA